VVASSTKAALIIRLWAASDVVALDLRLCELGSAVTGPAGPAAARAGWVLS